MINLPFIDSQESSPSQKLSRIHRRVYPLSLFPTPGPESPLSTFRVSTPVKTPRNFPKPRENKQLTTSIPTKARSNKVSAPPILRIKDFEKGNFKGSEDRYYYQPNYLKISPRSKVTIYTAAPFHEGFQTIGYGNMGKDFKNLETNKAKKFKFNYNYKDKDEHTNKNKNTNTNTNKNKNKHINKTHKRNITEDYDIPISGNKLSRITPRRENSLCQSYFKNQLNCFYQSPYS